MFSSSLTENICLAFTPTPGKCGGGGGGEQTYNRPLHGVNKCYPIYNLFIFLNTPKYVKDWVSKEHKNEKYVLK